VEHEITPCSDAGSDFTEIRQFVLVDTEGRFLTMAPPTEIRRALAKALPKLEMVYLQSRDQPRNPQISEVDHIIFHYPAGMGTIFPGQSADSVKQIMTPARVRELGIKSQGEVLEVFGSERRPLLNSDILRRLVPYIVLMRNGILEGVIDRLELASRIVSTALQ
jgi:hypothetical protein